MSVNWSKLVVKGSNKNSSFLTAANDNFVIFWSLGISGEENTKDGEDDARSADISSDNELSHCTRFGTKVRNAFRLWRLSRPPQRYFSYFSRMIISNAL
jgi:hypothetical protein